MNKKKILVIGKSGGLSEEINYQIKNQYNLKFLGRKDVDAFKSYKKYYYEIKKFKPDYVINTIAVNGIKYCEDNPKEAYFINGYLPKIIHSYSKTLRFKLIHFSSDTVFEGKQFNKKYSDQSIPKPWIVLGKSKHMSETFLLNKKDVIIIRVSMLFGPRHKKHLIHKLLINLKKNKTIYASRDVYSTPVYTPDLVSFVNEEILMKEKLFTNKIKRNLINFSSNKYISVFNLMKIFAKNLDKEKYLISVKDSFFNKSSMKPRYLGLKSKMKYTTNKNLQSCVSHYLKQ